MWSLADLQTQTLVLRLFHSLFILLAFIELFRASYLVNSERITRILWKASLSLGSFFVARIVASIIDNAIAHDIGWFSNLVNILFWGYLLLKIRAFRLILADGRNTDRRIALRASLDELLEEMDDAKKVIRQGLIDIKS